jgi:hypothetical protein
VYNVLALTVDSGPAGAINTAFVTVTVCAPGGTNCQSVDHVTVDTGSSGLRLLASALSTPGAFPARTDASGNPLGECLPFADGYTWGSVRVADVQLGSKTAPSQSVQIIGDSSFAAVPSACSATGAQEENTVAALGANGILGIGVFREDCGAACASGASSPQLYYSCDSTGCAAAAVPLSSQLRNPVWQFASDNNGVILQLPAIDAGGAATANGSLIFGIDTESNNALGSATVLTVDSASGEFVTHFNNQSYGFSLFDSGSTALFFDDSALAQCTAPNYAGYYCPATVQNFTATVQGAGSGAGVTGTVAFSVANATSLLNLSTTTVAFRNLAAINPLGASYFTWGLPFFYGRSVYVAIEGQSTSAGTGPFEAYR